MNNLLPMSKDRTRFGLHLSTACLLAALAATGPAFTQERPVPDTFEATTTGMTPEGVTLKLNVLSWSDEATRALVVGALNAAEFVPDPISELPTAGVVWRSDSAVGRSIKYAYRDQDENGNTRVTVVTDQALDAHNFRAWAVPGRDSTDDLEYSVIQITLPEGADGSGYLSYSADVILDTEDSTVSLGGDGAIAVLTGARELPKPYWARASDDG